MTGIGVAGIDGRDAAGVLFKDFGHMPGDHHRAEREIAVCDGFCRAHEVRLYAPVACAALAAGATEGGDDLVGDQENAVAVTDFAHHRHEARMGRHDTTGAEDGLHDEGGNGAGSLEGDLVFESGCAELGKFRRIALVERIAVGVGSRNVETARQQRLVSVAELAVAVDAGAAEMGAMIAFLQAEKLGAAGFAANAVIF